MEHEGLLLCSQELDISHLSDVNPVHVTTCLCENHFNIIVPSMPMSPEPLFFYFVCESIGTAAAPGLLCQPRVTVKMIVEKKMECRLAEETEVLGENLLQRYLSRCFGLYRL
jgi:hypothetical protein